MEEESRIGTSGSTTGGPGGRPASVSEELAGGSRRSSAAARAAAIGALGVALVVVAILILGGGNGYTLNADFQNASGLVTGDNVLIGPAAVGTINSISLARNGQARVQMSLRGGVGPMHQGTVARIFEDSLSGIASRYVALEPGPRQAPPIADGGLITSTHTYAEVNIDQLFDTFDPLTRAGLKGLIRGEGAAIEGRGVDANKALKYLAPGLQTTSQVTAELARDQPTFDQLVIQGANALSALAARSQQLSALIAHTSTATGAIASQSQSLQEALRLLPSTLRRATTTFGGLQTTLNALDPLVAASKPAVRQLPEFLSALNKVIVVGIPTIGALDDLIHNPAGTGDLTTLAQTTPSLARIAATAFPEMVKQLNDSQTQVVYLRQYTPDVIAALTNLGQAGAYYDANGHYVRTQPALFPFGLNASNELTMQFPSQRYDRLQAVRDRCPGSASQPTPDGSAPQPVPGCSTSAVPPGP
ncbi:MAG TPA: MlaD family protein [Solirubrobacteraceae bacterium]|jgi:phospholipid/cholesterol/gamma-HCH transport system substrate-binding protein